MLYPRCGASLFFVSIRSSGSPRKTTSDQVTGSSPNEVFFFLTKWDFFSHSYLAVESDQS